MKRIVLLLAILLVIFVSIRYFSPKKILTKSVEVSPAAAAAETLHVARVIDGDTIVLENGQHVRYIGINTPEMESKECFSTEATTENKTLVEGKIVRLQKDSSETDKYDRLLRYVYVGDVFINDVLVRQGFAKIEPVKPDTAFAGEFSDAQQEARANNRGLWNTCLK